MHFILNQHYQILRFSPEVSAAFRQKLLSLGLLPGVSFQVKRIAPLGDPLQIQTRHVNLILRKKDLAFLQLATLS